MEKNAHPSRDPPPPSPAVQHRFVSRACRGRKKWEVGSLCHHQHLQPMETPAEETLNGVCRAARIRAQRLAQRIHPYPGSDFRCSRSFMSICFSVGFKKLVDKFARGFSMGKKTWNFTSCWPLVAF